MRYLLRIEGKDIKRGDIIRDFRNKEWKFLDVTLSGRRVYVEELEKKNNQLSTFEFFPSVFKAEIIEEP
jgi:hypothetical protein